MGITRLYTADIYVHDLDKALDFYVNKLGFEKRADEPVDEEGHRWVEVAPNGSETALVLAQGFGSWSPEKVGGWCRLIFRVEDMAGTVRGSQGRGGSVRGRARRVSLRHLRAGPGPGRQRLRAAPGSTRVNELISRQKCKTSQI